jgi:hypothetical protein
MTTAGAVLMILTGLVIMSFGLFLFYAWLPLLYALVGFDIGLLLGRSITGDVGATAIVAQRPALSSHDKVSNCWPDSKREDQ